MSKTHKDRKDWFDEDPVDKKSIKPPKRKKIKPKDINEILKDEDFIFGL